MPPGKHTIQMGASWNGWGFDVTYFITVPKNAKKRNEEKRRPAH
jgi:hypothetical protein